MRIIQQKKTGMALAGFRPWELCHFIFPSGLGFFLEHATHACMAFLAFAACRSSWVNEGLGCDHKMYVHMYSIYAIYLFVIEVIHLLVIKLLRQEYDSLSTFFVNFVDRLSCIHEGKNKKRLRERDMARLNWWQVTLVTHIYLLTHKKNLSLPPKKRAEATSKVFKCSVAALRRIFSSKIRPSKAFSCGSCGCHWRCGGWCLSQIPPPI